MGRMRSGKDFAADIWMNEVKGLVRVAFADALKKDVVDLGLATTREIEEKDPRTRRILQVWGTEVGRQLVHEDYWVHRWAAEVLLKVARGEVQVGILVPDVRYCNEASYILRSGGWIFYIDADRRLGRNQAVHRSEKQFENISTLFGDALRFRVVDNNGTVGEFGEKLMMALEDWRGGRSFSLDLLTGYV